MFCDGIRFQKNLLHQLNITWLFDNDCNACCNNLSDITVGTAQDVSLWYFGMRNSKYQEKKTIKTNLATTQPFKFLLSRRSFTENFMYSKTRLFWPLLRLKKFVFLIRCSFYQDWYYYYYWKKKTIFKIKVWILRCCNCHDGL